MPIIHDLSDVKSEQIGTNTRVWQFSIIHRGAIIGESCEICPHVLIESDVNIGNNVIIKPGVQICSGIDVADKVFIGPNVTFSNICFNINHQEQESLVRTTIHKGAYIGAGAIILRGIEIGANAIVREGSVITRTVPPNAIVEGNPVRITGYVNASVSIDATLSNSQIQDNTVGTVPTRVTGVTIHHFPFISDMRGGLTVGEFEKNVPFTPKRYFLVLDVPSREARGEHAHRDCHQFLICVKGNCSVVADDGANRQEFLLDRPSVGVHLPPMIWGIQYKYSPDAVLLVFASHYYDSADYIRDYSQFLQMLGEEA